MRIDLVTFSFAFDMSSIDFPWARRSAYECLGICSHPYLPWSSPGLVQGHFHAAERVYTFVIQEGCLVEMDPFLSQCAA